MAFFNRLGMKSRNVGLMYLSHLISGLIFFLPVRALYYESNLFSLTNVALIFSIEAVALSVFEVPSGAIADLFGRKRTLLLSFFMTLIGFTFLYIGGTMFMFILFALTNSFGRSLSSGTDVALIYDTLKQENKERFFKKIIGNYHALWPFGAVVGSIIGGYLAEISLSWTVLFSFIPVIISLLLVSFLKEPDYEKENHKNIFKHMFNSSRLIMGNKQLVLLLVGGFILWGLGESLHLFNSIFFEFKSIPLMYFGYISAAVFGFSSLGHYFSNSLSEKIGNKWTLILSSALSPVIVIIATLTGHLVAGFVFSLASIAFGLRNPMVHHFLNIEVSSSKRATILSMYNFAGQMGVAIYAPFLGFLAELYTINTAFQISAAMMVLAPVVFFFIKNKE